MTDREIIAALTQEICDRLRLIDKYISDDDEYLLRLLAECSIHLSFFLIESMGKRLRDNKELQDEVEKALKECSCRNFHIKIKDSKNIEAQIDL